MTLPGHLMTAAEIRQIVDHLVVTPTSVVLIVGTDATVATMPPFRPTPAIPTPAAFFRSLADEMDRAE